MKYVLPFLVSVSLLFVISCEPTHPDLGMYEMTVTEVVDAQAYQSMLDSLLNGNYYSSPFLTRSEKKILNGWLDTNPILSDDIYAGPYHLGLKVGGAFGVVVFKVDEICFVFSKEAGDLTIPEEKTTVLSINCDLVDGLTK